MVTREIEARCRIESAGTRSPFLRKVNLICAGSRLCTKACCTFVRDYLVFHVVILPGLLLTNTTSTAAYLPRYNGQQRLSGIHEGSSGNLRRCIQNISALRAFVSRPTTRAKSTVNSSISPTLMLMLRPDTTCRHAMAPIRRMALKVVEITAPANWIRR